MMRTVAALAGRDLRRFFRQPSRIVGSAAHADIIAIAATVRPIRHNFMVGPWRV